MKHPRGAAMIIEYDFGKKQRSSSKQPARSAIADASNRMKVSGKAQIHLEFANARIAKLEAALRDAQAATAGAQSEVGRGQILVEAAEYARLLRCKDLVAAALRDLEGSRD